ncbi:MAG: hypothetical protein D6808_05085 [Candidatus Dadabacteria bacterium]|nr:MAG: hypothetical protein D6808_05085 [Candidatus Dadabacteria bacterium]
MNVPLKPGEISEIAHLVINDLLPSEITEGKEIEDIKGKDIIHNTNRKELLLSIKGSYGINEEKEPFALECTTSFKEFKGVHHIVHNIDIERDGLPSVPLKWIAWVFPVSLCSVSLFVEVFSSVRSIILGYSPQVTESLYIELSKGALTVTIKKEKMKRKEEAPLEKYALFKKLCRTLKEVKGINLSDDYWSKIKQ